MSGPPAADRPDRPDPGLEVRRAYEASEVDALVARLTSRIEALESELEALRRAAAEDGHAGTRNHEETLVDLVALAQRTAETTLHDANEVADRVLREAEEEAARIVANARGAADHRRDGS